MPQLRDALRFEGSVARSKRHRTSDSGRSQAPDFLWSLTFSPVVFLPSYHSNIYYSHQQFLAGYYGNFANLCVEHDSLRLCNRLVFEAIDTVFFNVCFYRFCLGIVSQTTPVPVNFVLRQSAQ